MSDYSKTYKTPTDGVGVPILLSVGEELCDNRFFDDDTTGWNIWNASIEREEYETHIGNYVLKVEDSGANLGFTYYQVAVNPGTYDLLFGGWIMGIESDSWQGIIAFYDLNTLLGWKYINFTNSWEFYSILVLDATITNGTLNIRIFPTIEDIDVGSIRLINPKIRIVNNIAELGQPYTRNDSSKKEFFYDNTVQTMSKNDTILQGIRINDSINFNNINRNYLSDALEILQSKRIVYYPHLDADIFYLVRPDGDWGYGYLSNKYLAQTFTILLRNLELRDFLSMYGGW